MFLEATLSQSLLSHPDSDTQGEGQNTSREGEGELSDGVHRQPSSQSQQHHNKPEAW